MRVAKDLPRKFASTWRKVTGEPLTIEQINWGWCYQFALVLRKLYGKRAQLYYNEYHAWVEIDGLKYDADRIHGVKQFKHSVYKEDVIKANMKKTEEYWNTSGTSGVVRWDVINEVIKLYTPGGRKRGNISQKARSGFHKKR